MHRSSLRVIGFAFWIGIFALVYASMRTGSVNDPSQSVSVVEYMVRGADHVTVVDSSGEVRTNEPVFAQADDGAWTQVGHIESVDSDDPATFVMQWYAKDVQAQEFELTAFRTSGQLDEVIATLLPSEKREQIRWRLERAFQQHGDEMMQSLLPVVQSALQQSLPVIELEVRRSTQRHQAEIDSLTRRLNSELVDQRLIPLARREVIPIVRKHGQPIAEAIGRELWDRASLWRFGWRAAYDRSPFPERGLLQQEWDRFVENDAIPVFNEHMDEIAVASQQAIAEIAASQAIRNELSGVANSLVSDPETVRLLRVILREAIVDNPKLHEVWRNVWSSDEARRALAVTSDHFEPVIRQIGDDLFGSEEEGINPDFARVLRNQILGKDRRWIIALPSAARSSDTTMVIRPARHRMSYPVVYLADRNDMSGAGQ